MVELEELKWQWEKVKEDVSVLRKKGEDMNIAELKLMQVGPKIKLAQVTNAKKDVDRIVQLLSEVRTEINEIAESDDVCMVLCDQRLMQIQEALAKKDRDMARLFYDQIRRYYPRLKAEEKTEVTKRLMPLVQLMQQNNAN